MNALGAVDAPGSGPSWLANATMMEPGETGQWQELDDFLAPAVLQGRQRAVADGLAPLRGEADEVDSCAWALVALNLTGWILAPVLARALRGLQPRAGWAAALHARAAAVGPVELGIRSDLTQWRPDVDVTSLCAGVEELALMVRVGLEAAGAPGAQTIGAISSTLNTVATEPIVDRGTTLAATGVLWRALVPEPLRTGGPPGAGDFRRPVCCGLAGLAGDPRSACGDCPGHDAL